MKTTKMILVLLLAAGTVLSLGAQESTSESNPKMRFFGIGFRTSPFNLDDAVQNNFFVTNNRLIMTINSVSYFRIQPEFGYYSIKHLSEELREEVVDRNFSVGIGFFGMWQKEKTNFYAGPKISIVKNVYNSAVPAYNNTLNYTTYQKNVETTSYTNFGLMLGGEYYIGMNFSIGSELGIISSKAKVDNSQSIINDFTFSRLLTEANLLLRFYF